MSARSSCVEPRAVAELDERDERVRGALGRASELGLRLVATSTKRGWYWRRTPRSLPESSSGSSAARKSRERLVRRLASCHVIAADAFT